MLTLSFTFGIVSFVAREKIKNPTKCDMRKCRNWQTSKTKDLVSIVLVWVQVPSSALKNEELCEFMVPYFFLLLFRILSATGPPVKGGAVAYNPVLSLVWHNNIPGLYYSRNYEAFSSVSGTSYRSQPA